MYACFDGVMGVHGIRLVEGWVALGKDEVLDNGLVHYSPRRRTSASAPLVMAREKREGSHVVLTKTVPAATATALAPSMGTESLAQLCLTAATEENAAMVMVVDVKPNEAMRPVLGKSIESETQLVRGLFLGLVRSKRK